MINRKLHLSALSMAVMALPFSIRVCHWSLVLYVVLWCAEGKWQDKIMLIRKSLLLQLFLAFAALLFIGMFYTENKAEGWLSLEKKIFYFIMPLTLATSAISFTKNEIRIVLYGFVTSCFAVTLICLANAFFLASEPATSPGVTGYLNASDFKLLNPEATDQWLFFSYLGLANGIGMHPAYISMYLTFCIIILLSDFPEINARQKALKAGVGALIIYFSIFVICLASRVVILSLMLIYLTVIILSISSGLRRKNAYGLCFLLALCLLMLYINPVSRYKNLQEIWQSSFSIHETKAARTSTQIRASLLWIGWKSFSNTNLLTGAGTGDVEKMMHKTSEEYSIPYIHTYNPHNQYISIAIGLGLIGLISFIASLVLPFMLAFSHRDYLLMGFIFLFASLCFSETVLERQKGVAFFALFFPILAFHRRALQTYQATLKISGARS